MNRRKLLKVAGVAAASTVISAPAIAQSTPVLRWRLTTSFPKTLDTLYGACEMFAKTMADLSDQKFQISVYGPGEIVPAFQVLDAVANNTVEMGNSASYYYIGKDLAFAFGTAVPFGLNTRQMNAWLTYGGGLDMLNELNGTFGIVAFPFGNTTAQMGGWFRKEVKSLADIKGLKFRIGGFGGKVIERIGGVPQNIPGGEIYQALEKGTIDAAEWVGPYDDLKLGFNKVAPNYYYPGWWEGGPQLDFFINNKAWEGLSAEYKAMVEAAASHAHVDMLAKYDHRNPAALKTLVGQGTKLFRFPKDMMEGAFKASGDVYAELSSSNADWKKIYADFSAWRRDANLWFRFTEAGFDDFMQAQKL